MSATRAPGLSACLIARLVKLTSCIFGDMGTTAYIIIAALLGGTFGYSIGLSSKDKKNKKNK